MSKYTPVEVQTKDYVTVAKPALGQEFDVYLSPEPVSQVATIELPVDASGVLNVDPSAAAALEAAPNDLQLVVTGFAKGDDNIVVTLAVVDEADAPTTAIATFTPPAWAKNQSNAFPEGYAVDMVVGTGKKVKSITGLTSVTHAQQGSQFKVLSLPAAETYALVGCTTERNFTTKARPSVPIACGPDGSRFVKRGRSKPGELNVTAKYFSAADGLARYAGVSCTAKVIVEKDGLIPQDVLVFGNWVPEVDPTAGDGDDNASQAAKGMYEHFAMFVPD